MTPYERAKTYRGTAEIAGDKHNPLIIKWFGLAGHAWVQDDETAWCAAFMCAMLEESGITSPKTLRARDFEGFGTIVPLGERLPGDIATFWRKSRASGFGHVAFWEADKANGDVQAFGGNQRNRVGSDIYSGDQLLSVRRVPGLHAPARVRRQTVSRKPSDGPRGLFHDVFRDISSFFKNRRS